MTGINEKALSEICPGEWGHPSTRQLPPGIEEVFMVTAMFRPRQDGVGIGIGIEGFFGQDTISEKEAIDHIDDLSEFKKAKETMAYIALLSVAKDFNKTGFQVFNKVKNEWEDMEEGSVRR